MAYPWLTVFLEGTHATSAPKKTWTREDMQHIVSTTKTATQKVAARPVVEKKAKGRT